MATNLTLTAPYEQCVYQRNADNSALIPITGNAPGASEVTATFEVVPVGDVQMLAYAVPIAATIPVNADGSFANSVSVPGGWYKLTVSAGSEQAVISRVGVGEVFIKFGHSYMDGGHDATHQLPANDERVITLLDDMASRNYQFGKLTGKVGPMNGTPDAWGQFGDLLVKRLNVPVLIYGSAYGGSNLKMNLEVIHGLPLTHEPPGYAGPQSRQPFAPLETVLTNYVPKTGVRAILVEHGYNDRGTSRETFLSELNEFFSYVRQHWQVDRLPIVMVQEQLTAVPGSLYDIPTAQAQQDFMATFPAVWKGPDFNGSAWNGLFTNHDHLYGYMIDLFAQQWADSLTPSFFAQSIPYLARDVPAMIDSSTDAVANAPTGIQAIDWVLLIFTGIVFVLFYIRRNRTIGISFLLLALLCLARLVR
ncbi:MULTISPECIES: hypothetical protein [unclassified Spirosoma]|uniref:hypothetical protein n=1 Tax=unclassified Spirosoma TaxID=2621999 RepID=UPI000967834D|nr:MULTISPECIES: hypothetical protein [unclassified Spirosoma]MBN8823877.1 hypothetical protein [Spirosoma sp.]OJW79731.1 MAG: hypothetical protein BGO59_00310 [Spirosoma sp. 48-14]